jgi:uncharacterized protein
MLYLRICKDRTGAFDLREKHMEAHSAYMRSGKIEIVQAGPMCISDADNAHIGSFMIIEARSRAEVQTFHDDDPFTDAGVYGEVTICRWEKHIG